MIDPKDAASLIILRDTLEKESIEVLMVRRSRNASFVPDVYVFPGGSLEEGDYAQPMEKFCSGLNRNRLHGLFPDIKSPKKAMGAYVAAIRETFEEAGIILAYEEKGGLISLDSPEKRAKYKHYRQALIAGKIKFIEILERENLTLATDCLHYFSHWITPELSPIRFNVRFFMAEIPPHQEVAHDGQELTEHRWINPSHALSLFERGEFNLVLPTAMNLAEISQFRSTACAIKAVQKKQVQPVLSELRLIDGEVVEILPQHERGKEMRKLYFSVTGKRLK